MTTPKSKEKKFSNAEQVFETYIPNYPKTEKVYDMALGKSVGDQLAIELLTIFRQDLKKIRQQDKEKHTSNTVSS